MTAWLTGEYHASPVWGGKSLKIGQQYGPTTLSAEPDRDGEHFHCGIDVSTVLGTPLYAARAGKVGHVSYALLAVVSTQCDWYVHIDRAVVPLGATVAKGQLIAYSGAKAPSGGTLLGVHTHFEVQNVAAARTAYYDANGRLIVPPGALNNPYTSVDPVAVLAGLFSSSGSAIAPTVRRRNSTTLATTKSLHQFCRGGGPAFNLYHRRRVGGVWSLCASLGGRLADSGISAGVDDAGTIIVSVEGQDASGPDGLFYDIVSTDDGVTWSAFAANGAGGDSLMTLSTPAPITAVTGAALTPEQAAQLAKAADESAAAHAAATAAASAVSSIKIPTGGSLLLS